MPQLTTGLLGADLIRTYKQHYILARVTLTRKVIALTGHMSQLLVTCHSN